jgi:hypothetical protein
MGGGLMQLVAYGAQDIYLTGNPQITFFKVVYRRHTNFSMESIEQTFNGSADFGKKVSCTISRNGDLIHQVYLEVTVSQVVSNDLKEFKWVKNLGYALINEVEIEIGGQRIDKHYGNWMQIWSELTHSNQKMECLEKMITNDTIIRVTTDANEDGSQTTATIGAKTLYIPLQFWFCKNPGCALPLIALQYHEVKINLTFLDSNKLLLESGKLASNPTLDGSLYVDYIYLDTDERRRFAQVSHEYLIEQLQFTGEESASTRHTLNFNHPVKELIWVTRNDINISRNLLFNYDTGVRSRIDDIITFGSTGPNTTTGLKFSINGGSNILINWLDALANESFINILGTNDDAVILAQSFIDAVNGNKNNHVYGITSGAAADHAGVVGVTAVHGSSAGKVSLIADSFGSVEISVGDGGAPTNVTFDDGVGGSSLPITLIGAQTENNPTSKAKLQLNGHDRFSERNGSYFNWVQPYQHHTGNPSSGINVYSFGLTPEEHQPSGTCNFSRIDNAQLQITRANSEPSKTSIFAINYNVLRIMSGMGGLAYSN